MYEEPKTSVIGKVIRFALFIIVVLAIVWIVVWFFFLRNNGASDTAQKTPAKPATSQPKTTSKPSNTSTTPPATASTPPTTTPTPTNALPSTGPGNILPLAAVWAGAGSLVYYVRLRHKAVKETI